MSNSLFADLARLYQAAGEVQEGYKDFFMCVFLKGAATKFPQSGLNQQPAVRESPHETPYPRLRVLAGVRGAGPCR
jgi:hypothetical protein